MNDLGQIKSYYSAGQMFRKLISWIFGDPPGKLGATLKMAELHYKLSTIFKVYPYPPGRLQKI